MKQKKTILLHCLIIIIFSLFQVNIFQNKAFAYRKLSELRVKVTGLKSSSGLVRFGLYNSKESYNNKTGAFRGDDLPVENNSSEWALKGIPFGEYAVMLYHDQNSNNKLDKNFFGIPKEKYGFSNNVRPFFSQPGYNKAKFMVKEKYQTIEITVK